MSPKFHVIRYIYFVHNDPKQPVHPASASEVTNAFILVRSFRMLHSIKNINSFPKTGKTPAKNRKGNFHISYNMNPSNRIVKTTVIALFLISFNFKGKKL